MDNPVFYPHFVVGGWMQGGRRRQVETGVNNIIVQAPSVELDGLVVMLDRCHRVRQLRPRIVVLDSLVVDAKAATCFADLLNSHTDHKERPLPRRKRT